MPELSNKQAKGCVWIALNDAINILEKLEEKDLALEVRKIAHKKVLSQNTITLFQPVGWVKGDVEDDGTPIRPFQRTLNWSQFSDELPAMPTK
jgi:hypothetical protein